MNTRNTLGKSVTRSFFRTEDGYDALKAHWATIQSSASLSAANHLLYAVLMGRDWRKGFTPVSNPVKLANGHGTWRSRDGSLWAIHSKYCQDSAWGPFTKFLSEEAIVLIRAVVPTRDSFDGAAYTPATEESQ